MKTCKICKITKELIHFHPCGTYKDKTYYRGECKECNKTIYDNAEACRKYRRTEKGSKNRKEYKKSEAGLASQRKYENSKYRKDHLYKIKKNLRRRLLSALKVKTWQKDTSFSTYIGCSGEELKRHIEKQFQPGMTWDNYGFGTGKWCIDHIKPLSLALNAEEMYSLAHFSNLQPMWFDDNQVKTNKYEKN